MIIVEDVYKRYQTDHGAGPWVLQGVSLTIPPRTNVGLVGGNGAGKSTLLRLIGGVDQPTRGRIERRCRVSWPMGLGGGLQGTLTGRQNAKFACRVYGYTDAIPERLAYIQEFADIGDAFDQPVKTYSSGMRARLKFGISLAFDFDVYISDEVTAVGDAAFKEKARAAFEKLVGRAGLIMVSHQLATLKQFCTAGIWLHQGRAQWFDDLDDAFAAYQASIAEAGDEGPAARQARALKKKEVPVGDRLKRLRKTLKLIEQGVNGAPAVVGLKEAERLVGRARTFDLELMSVPQLARRGYRIMENALPILRARGDGSDEFIDYYDLKTQCSNAHTDDD